MFTADELRNGTTFVYRNDPYRVVKYRHSHISRRGANYKVKAKNLKTGSVQTFTFGSKDKFEDAFLQKKKMQYLYSQDDSLVLMDLNDYQQKQLDKKKFEKAAKFLKEGEEVYVWIWDDEILEIDLPTAVALKVEKAPPGVKGDSATGATKKVTLENGLEVRVPLFINKGEKILVDTRSEEYLERFKD